MTFRGRSIFYQNTHEDSGAFQFYGSGVSNYVVGLTGTRMGVAIFVFKVMNFAFK